jgi:hypothetical protein
MAGDTVMVIGMKLFLNQEQAKNESTTCAW